MPTSNFFNFYKSRQEQSLIEDLVNESLNMFGFNGYYIPRNGTIDIIYGEDVLKTFPAAYVCSMRLENQIDPGMNQDFFSKFGLEIRNSIKLHLARREFMKQVPQDLYTRPMEGDLIFIPHLSGQGELYEIKYVNDSIDHFTLGRKYPFYWELELELFKYSNEEIDTGIPNIDIVNSIDAYSIVYTMGTGTGNYLISEIAYQGSNTASASAYGTVQDWNSVTLELRLTNIVGEFSNTGTIIGSTSNTVYSLSNYDPLDYPAFENAWDNLQIETESDNVIDTSESNPFGLL
jgi:Virus neck protein